MTIHTDPPTSQSLPTLNIMTANYRFIAFLTHIESILNIYWLILFYNYQWECERDDRLWVEVYVVMESQSFPALPSK